MEKLKIQPVEYKGKRLNEVGDRIIKVFDSVLSDYQISDVLDVSDIESILIKSNTDPQKKLKIVGGRFIDFLPNYGIPIIGVTSLPCLKDSGGRWVYGQGGSIDRAAYVSTSRPEFDKIDSDIHIERLIIESLHEIGHVFGLHEHYSSKKTLNGMLCPMDSSHASKAFEGKITWEEYISSRDSSSFCKACLWNLKNYNNLYKLLNKGK